MSVHWGFECLSEWMWTLTSAYWYLKSSYRVHIVIIYLNVIFHLIGHLISCRLFNKDLFFSRVTFMVKFVFKVTSNLMGENSKLFYWLQSWGQTWVSILNILWINQHWILHLFKCLNEPLWSSSDGYIKSNRFQNDSSGWQFTFLW